MSTHPYFLSFHERDFKKCLYFIFSYAIPSLTVEKVKSARKPLFKV